MQLARRILFEHEFFHFVAETACARAEVVGKTCLYNVYFPHPFAAPLEEALANAHSFRKAMVRLGPRWVVRQPTPVKRVVSKWMQSQGPGYRDFQHWLRPAQFEEGCRRAAHYMLQAIGVASGAGGSGSQLGSTSASRSSSLSRSGSSTAARSAVGIAPADFLFALPPRKSVPTWLVVDATVGILKPFPKYAGMRAVVFTKEHPPPHFHIERPPGRLVTKYLWPGLTPYPGEPQLSSSGKKDLDTYVERYGREIDEKVRRVYSS